MSCSSMRILVQENIISDEWRDVISSVKGDVRSIYSEYNMVVCLRIESTYVVKGIS